MIGYYISYTDGSGSLYMVPERYDACIFISVPKTSVLKDRMIEDNASKIHFSTLPLSVLNDRNFRKRIDEIDYVLALADEPMPERVKTELIKESNKLEKELTELAAKYGIKAYGFYGMCTHNTRIVPICFSNIRAEVRDLTSSNLLRDAFLKGLEVIKSSRGARQFFVTQDGIVKVDDRGTN